MSIRRLTLSLLAVAALAAGCGKKEPPKPAAKVAAPPPNSISAGPELSSRIALGDATWLEVRETMRVPGRVEVDEARLARIGSPVAGRITDLDATVGQSVRRGQVLATLNSTELSSAQLNFLREQSQRLQALRATERAEQLLKADVIGTAEVQRRQSELTQAEAELNAARDQLKVLGMSEGAIQRLAETGTITSRTQIVASVSGTVIERRITEGQMVQPADSVFLIADLSHVWIVADIPEQASGVARVGEPAAAEIAALPGQQVRGKLAFVSPTVNPETRTVRARMNLANAEGLFKPAMLASMLINGKPQKRQVVPAGAIVREENRDHVFVQAGGDAYQMRPVSLGPEHEGRRVLLEGLRDGERIVVEGAFHLNNERKRRALVTGQ
jgi:cobalt-zinc-cadmium efflux system membrane fusion protein